MRDQRDITRLGQPSSQAVRARSPAIAEPAMPVQHDHGRMAPRRSGRDDIHDDVLSLALECLGGLGELAWLGRSHSSDRDRGDRQSQLREIEPGPLRGQCPAHTAVLPRRSKTAVRGRFFSMRCAHRFPIY